MVVILWIKNKTYTLKHANMQVKLRAENESSAPPSFQEAIKPTAFWDFNTRNTQRHKHTRAYAWSIHTTIVFV